VTHFRVLRSNARYSLVEVLPKTGRTHQIRVHMASLGCPLVGDKLYGADETLFLRQIDGTLDEADRASPGARTPRAALAQAAFHHPMLGREMTVTAPLPADMAALVD
jgi:23S rRNA pseudouridine1911/1915/1917 synthase